MASLSKRLRDSIGDSFGADVVEMNLEKAIEDMRVRSQRGPEPESQFYDPVSMFMGREWLQRTQEGLSSEDLRRMAKNPIVGSIIQTRKNQVASFCQPQKDEYDLGFVIEGHRGKKLNEASRLNIVDWVQGCGLPGHGEPIMEGWVRKFIEDSLILDQATTEIVNARDGTPAYLVSVDAATVKRLPSSLNYVQSDEPVFCQVIQEKIVAEYRHDQMIFAVRNEKTDLNYAGYGMSELETLIRTVSTIINAERYNSGQLQQGGMQKGFFVIKGEAGSDQVASFKRDLRETLRNGANLWSPPVLQISKDGEVKWEAMDRSQKDMEYSGLFEFLVKQACGIYQIDPSEVNWQISGHNQITYEGNNNQKVRNSQNKGLLPLLTFISNQLNMKVINRLDPAAHIAFKGYDRDKEADIKVAKDEVQYFKTVNEKRAELGLKPIPGGDIILNEVFGKITTGGYGDTGEQVTIDG